MKNTVTKLLALLLVFCMAAAVFTACGNTEDPTPSEPTHIDYAVEQKLDMSSSTMKQEVTFGPRSQIDGDPADRECEPTVLDGGTDPVPGLLHSSIRQTNNIKTENSVRNIGFNIISPHLCYIASLVSSNVNFTS